MVRPVTAIPRIGQRQPGRGVRVQRCWTAARFVFGFLLVVGSGCAIVPRSRMDECQRLALTLRSENARMKDQVLATKGQNRDYAERAVDDAKRLAVQDEAIERLEHSVQAYQDERTRLEAAYQQLASSLGVAEPPDRRQSQASPKSALPDESGAPATARGSKCASGVDDNATPR